MLRDNQGLTSLGLGYFVIMRITFPYIGIRLICVILGSSYEVVRVVFYYDVKRFPIDCTI